MPPGVTPGFVDGMLLAATATGDREGSAAGPGLAPGLAGALDAHAAAVAELPTPARRARIRALAASLRAVDPAADVPPRVRGLLAAAVDREVGRRWAAEAPPVRRGYSLHPTLKATLRRLAQPSADGAAEAERAAAAHADPRLRPWAEHLADDPGDATRVLGALALGAAGDRVGDATSHPWRRIGAELAEVWEAAWRG